MRVVAIAAAIAAGFACSPRAHRAFQVTAVGVAQAAVVHALLQTRTALRGDPDIVETNPLLGEDPGGAVLVGAGLVNTGVGAAILAIPRGPRHDGDWVINLVAATWVLMTVSWAVNDTAVTGERWYR